MPVNYLFPTNCLLSQAYGLSRKKTGIDGIYANATENDSRLCDLVSPTVLDRPCITLSSSSWGVGYARQTVQQKNKWILYSMPINWYHWHYPQCPGSQSSLLVSAHNECVKLNFVTTDSCGTSLIPIYKTESRRLAGKRIIGHSHSEILTLKLKSWIIWELRVDSQLPPQPFLLDQMGWIHVF